jgi:hypothetical protein
MRERTSSDAQACAALRFQIGTLKMVTALRSLGLAFQFPVQGFADLMSQIVTSSSHGGRHTMPWEPVTQDS